MAELATSLDGQWAVVRDGRALQLHAGGSGAAVARIQLDSDDVQLGWLGPPATLAVVSAGACTLFQPPTLEPIGRLELPVPARLAAITGARCVLLGRDGKVTVVRVAARAVATSTLEVGPQIELAVGLDRNNVLFVQPKQLAVWDAASGRPMAKLQLQLPPPPRTLGAAAGHLWAHRKDAPELFIYRLSDGRPFRHTIGASIARVISHPASPLIVLATAQGLVRLHCFAHSLVAIDAPYTPDTALGMLAAGDDIALVGLPPGTAEPWRVVLATGAHGPVTVAEVVRAEPSRPEPRPEPAALAPAQPAPAKAEPALHAPAKSSSPAAWREPLVEYAEGLAHGEADPPSLGAGTELGELVHRLALSQPARRALVALYAHHLIGKPALAIAKLARATGDWIEPLGQGELAELGLLRRERGEVALAEPVTDLLDGARPRAIRLAGSASALVDVRPGIHRVARDGRTDAEIELELATRLGRIAIVTGPIATALVEARLHDAIAVAYSPPPERPHPWPRDAALVLVLYGSPSAWVADLPSL